MEMSRQRLRPSLAEASFILCPHCGGTGHVRSTENAAIHVLRGIEDEGSKRRAAEIVVYMATPIALYILNHKRDRLHEIESLCDARDDPRRRYAGGVAVPHRPCASSGRAGGCADGDHAGFATARLAGLWYEPEEVVGGDDTDLEAVRCRRALW